MLLRRIAPLATTVFVLLAPATARATSDSPDPAPGATVLQPDRAPAAAPAPVAKVVPRPRRVVVSAAQPVERRTIVVSVPRTPVAAAPRPPQRPKPAKVEPAPRPHKKHASAPIRFAVPPVLSPAFFEPSGSTRGPVMFAAAVALALAALTACSGAGLVVSWSRR